MGPNIKPCVYLIKVFEKHSVSFIFTPSFLRFKYECTKVTASFDKPYARSFATSKS